MGEITKRLDAIRTEVLRRGWSLESTDGINGYDAPEARYRIIDGHGVPLIGNIPYFEDDSPTASLSDIEAFLTVIR